MNIATEILRIGVVCQQLKGQHDLVSFNRRKGVSTAKLRLTTTTDFLLIALGRFWGAECKFFLPSVLSPCSNRYPGQNFAYSVSELRSLQDEDHPRSCPNSFPASCQARSRTFAEWFRGGPVITGSEELCRVVIDHLRCGSLSY